MWQELVDAFDGVGLVDLGAADARGFDLHQYLPVIERCRQRDFIDDQGLTGFDKDRCLCGFCTYRCA
jgi:hypothetical protein